MPLLKPSISEKLNATVTLERSTIERLNLYATYTATNADAVMNEALEYVFAKDKEFAVWCEKSSLVCSENPQSTSGSLRVTGSTAASKRRNASSRTSNGRENAQDRTAKAVQ